MVRSLNLLQQTPRINTTNMRTGNVRMKHLSPTKRNWVKVLQHTIKMHNTVPAHTTLERSETFING